MSSLPEILESLSGPLPAALSKAAEDVVTALDQVSNGSEDIEDVKALHEALVANRKAIDRIQYIFATLMIRKAAVAKKHREAKDLHEDAYAKAATSPTMGFNEYSSAKQRDSQAHLASMEEALALRVAENSLKDVDAVIDFVRSLQRSAEGNQRDIETRVRMINLAGQLDR